MSNKLLFFLLLLFSNFVVGQDSHVNELTLKEQKFRTGFSMKLALIPQRSLLFPEEAVNSSFYQEHFGLVPSPQGIDRGTATFQFAGNAAWILFTKNQRVAFELGLDLGYQNSGNVQDRIYKTVNNSDTNYTSAEINVDYKLDEIFGGGYALAKTNNPLFNVYIGLGISVYTSVGSAIVTNSWQGKELDSYKTRIPNYTNINPYIPLGIEFRLSQKKDDFHVKLMGSLRREVNEDNFQPNRFFLTAGFQFQYQF